MEKIQSSTYLKVNDTPFGSSGRYQASGPEALAASFAKK